MATNSDFLSSSSSPSGLLDVIGKAAVRPILRWQGIRDTVCTMTASAARHRPHRGKERLRFSALLAFLALVGMIALSYWHDAMPHVHDIDPVVSIDLAHHVHAPDKAPDNDGMMHIAAHVVLQTIAIPTSPMLADMVAPLHPIWRLAPPETGRPGTPLSILRPPQG